MDSTNIISLLALVVSLISFWLSYRTMSKNNLVIVAEKRYEAYNICIETLLHLQVLYLALMKLQEKLRAMPVKTDGNAKIEKFMAAISQRLDENITAHQYLLQQTEELSERIKTSAINDPVFFEQEKSFTKEVSLRTKQIASNISNIETQLFELFTISNEPIKSSILLPD